MKHRSLVVLAACLGLVCPVGVRAGSVVADQTLRLPVINARTLPATTFLPVGDLFKPLLADPKEPRFYLSYLLVRTSSEKVHGGVGGYGEIFGLHRRAASRGGYDWQANFGGGIHAQFDLHAPSLDLVNTDYTIGFPFSVRKGAESYRIAIYHQSSHWKDTMGLPRMVNFTPIE